MSRAARLTVVLPGLNVLDPTPRRRVRADSYQSNAATSAQQVAGHAALGLMEMTLAGRVALTRRGRLLADSVAENFSFRNGLPHATNWLARSTF